MKYCSHCGKPLDEGAKFCGKCGRQIGDVKAQAPEEPSKVPTKAASQNFSEEEQAEIQKMEKNLKNAGDTGVALGWLQIIITIGLFLVGNFVDDLGDYQFGLTDVALYLPFSFMMIVLSKRVKTIRSIKIKRYLYILFVFSVLVVLLSFAGGGGAGILWFIYLFYLYRGIKSASRLEKVSGYFNENNLTFKINTPHWIALVVFTVIFVFVGAAFDYSEDDYLPYQTEGQNSTQAENDYSISDYVVDLKQEMALPSQIDESTTLVDITAQPNAIRYHYILSNFDTSQTSNNQLKAYLLPTLCENDDTYSLLASGVGMEYSYKVSGSQQTYFVAFDASDCY